MLLVVAATAVLALAVVTFLGRDGSSAVTVPRVATGLEPQPVVADTAGPVPAREEQTVAAPPPAPTRPAPTQTPPRDTAPSRDVAPPVESPPDTAPQMAVGDSTPAVAQALPLDTTPVIVSRPDPVPVAIGDSAPATGPSAGGPLQRFARTWVSIREGRTDSAPAVRTLEPGEAVLVDSLSQGWYRVVVSGRTEGYVDGAYLVSEAP